MRKDLIDSSIATLTASLGSIRRPVDEPVLERLFVAQDLVGMITTIQRVLRVDTRVRLGLVNSGGPRNAPAWIERPNPIPHFGSESFRRMTVTLYVRKQFLANVGFESLVMGFAHELCHVVLDATGNPLRKCEEAVDLTAMLLGFRDFYVTGCSAIHRVAGQLYVERLGYLTREEVMYAAQAMTYR